MGQVPPALIACLRREAGPSIDGQGTSGFLPVCCCQLKSGIGANSVQFHLLLKLVTEMRKTPRVSDVQQDGAKS